MELLDWLFAAQVVCHILSAAAFATIAVMLRGNLRILDDMKKKAQP